MVFVIETAKNDNFTLVIVVLSRRSSWSIRIFIWIELKNEIFILDNTLSTAIKYHANYDLEFSNSLSNYLLNIRILKDFNRILGVLRAKLKKFNWWRDFEKTCRENFRYRLSRFIRSKDTIINMIIPEARSKKLIFLLPFQLSFVTVFAALSGISEIRYSAPAKSNIL